MSSRERIEELLIVSPTPRNLERGALWFKENLGEIKKARNINPWWQNNSLLVEKDLVIKPSELLRKLLNLGYERSSGVVARGLFTLRGGVIEVWPIQSENPYLVEFVGNKVSEIEIREASKEFKKTRIYKDSVEKLPPGSYVVHEDHGIGILRGFTRIADLHEDKLNSSEKEAGLEYFIVEYAPPAPKREPDKLFVPRDHKERLTPYIGFETPKIHRLGGSLWHNTKRKVREDAEKLAQELLALYAKRSLKERPSYLPDNAIENDLRETFPYAETEDQLRAEEEILKDLESTRPMDRVLCGDVGFGKTEVALRAALRVILSGKQVVLLSPTTILAAQHEKTFRERLKNIPIGIGMLSRLTPPKEEKEILQKLTQGSLDLVIGTHRLLSKDIAIKNLGLVIIDEEQRFGVKQKERFKNIRSEVDILSLSATPIPRTLSLALTHLRDLSLLKTPPPERVPIQTAVLPYGKKLIHEAIEFELERGGQIYFLHNRIETIGHVKQKLHSLKLKNPLRIEVIHGRMPEREILKSMETFRKHQCDMLLATTIIENGLDISSANTLIVDDATRLGLAEAHQLRGRIGRSNIQAFAYFLFRPNRLSEKSLERLEALKEYSELGAGYEIALRDLEIRGAGNILGREQSGAINKVGLNLYCQMLAETIETLEK